MVIQDSGADSPWLFEEIPMTENLMPLRKITAGSLRLLMPLDLDAFIPITATRSETRESSNSRPDTKRGLLTVHKPGVVAYCIPVPT
jgi:hypothetical protein